MRFDETGSFKSDQGGTKRRKEYQRAASMPSSLANQPVRSERLVALPPPSGVARSVRRLPSKNNPSSPRYSLQPVNPSLDRVESRRKQRENAAHASVATDKAEAKVAQKPGRALSGHSQTTSTSSSSSSEERVPVVTATAAAAPTVPTALPRPPAASSVTERGRSERGRSASTGRPPASRERSNSSRHSTDSMPAISSRPKVSSSNPKKRSSSVTSNSRGRSRPPPTRNNNVQNAARSRSRTRSASLTRVTGPHTAPSARRSSSKRPPSTSGARETPSDAGGSSNSIGPGVSRRSSTISISDSHPDGNIGIELSFGDEMLQAQPRTASLDTARTVPKRNGLMEKLFGDQVIKPMHGGHTGSMNLDIRPRVLLAATVYHNTATNLWITTINTNQRGVARDQAIANRFLKAFSFSTEREARESAIANAPPKMVPFCESPNCFTCNGKFAVFRRAAHCRNCGVCICSTCSTSWPAKMIPETYNLKKEANVRICLGCNSLSGSFKAALLQGDYEEAVALYGTGNVNLRTPFQVPTKKDEVMFPIHCAVEGGNIDIIRWLIDDHFCPIKLVQKGAGKKNRSSSQDVPVLTSKGRSILSIAIDRVKVDIMRYLVIECGVSIYEITDLKNTLRALEAALNSLPVHIEPQPRRNFPVSTRWDKASFDDISEPSSLGIDEPLLDDNGTVGSRRSHRTRGSRSADACIICFDRKIDCCATPCGHQVCCLECSSNLSACPVCNTRGQFIKIYRP